METTMQTVRYTKLQLRKLRGEYQRALTAETRAIKRDVPLEKAWWYAANTDFYLNRLKLAEAGLPLPEPRTAKSKAIGGLKALAMIGKIIKKAFQVKAALVRAKAKAAALQAAKKARRALRSVLSTVARLVLAVLPTPTKEETMSDFSKNIVLCAIPSGGFWCLQGDGSLYTVQSGVKVVRGTILVDQYASIHDIDEALEAALFDEVEDAAAAVSAAKKLHRAEEFGWHIVTVAC